MWMLVPYLRVGANGGVIVFKRWRFPRGKGWCLLLSGAGVDETATMMGFQIPTNRHLRLSVFFSFALNSNKYGLDDGER
ncbi:unnamed protein product, partial [Iphiclides podalirius]